MIDKPTDRTVFQNAWVVDDYEVACTKWATELGVGPFFVSEYGLDLFEDTSYRGEPGQLSMFVAIAQAGPLQIEIIQPRVDRCAYRDSVPAGSDAFHHMCVWTHNIDADTEYFESLGYATANRATVGDIQFAYYDTRPLMGCMLEVVNQSAELLERFAMIQKAADGWDGKDPIRLD